MFYYLNGTVAHIEAYRVVIDCGGVGYLCNTTDYTISRLKRGEKARLYTYLHVREEIVELYGFATERECSCFKMLISVSGVGPKAAISILSSSTPEQLGMAIITGDEKALTIAPGIGKKIAQRVILELKDKLLKESGGAAAYVAESPVGTSSAVSGNPASEAAAALAVLGYQQTDIVQALQGLDAGKLTTEELVRQALKKMMKS